ncbi:MAG: BNR-4 repeat-containing protein [Pirellulaceae bacterium]|nr:BNR-4 repeat-containing protein [Pirellulaceae bacterium]
MRTARLFNGFLRAIACWSLLHFTCLGQQPLDREDGYRGIWYYNQPSKDQYRFKYSGGFATYPQQHIPIAFYSPEANKTYFVYGGTSARSDDDKQELLHMVSYFDHATGLVPQPVRLLNKQTSDAHDNPTLMLDDDGYLWIFSPSHGTSRPSFVHRSRQPYSIEQFERVWQTNFSYPQSWHLSGHGFLFLHTRYNVGAEFRTEAARSLFWMTSTDGYQWSSPNMLAAIELGDYQVSWRHGGRLGTAFDYHPRLGGLNARANIYYVETINQGRSWQTVDGHPVTTPITQADAAVLVYDSRSEDLLVYLKDLNFDSAGRPIILFLTSRGYQSGPENGPRQWNTARWTGDRWLVQPITQSLNNYDHGSLYIEEDSVWRVIAPTQAGPQPYNPGGEMTMWISRDQGATWQLAKQLTRDSLVNHTYARRPVNAHPDFYALWADGHGRQPSRSHLYFTNRDGTHVWRLPPTMTSQFAAPEIIW